MVQIMRPVIPNKKGLSLNLKSKDLTPYLFTTSDFQIEQSYFREKIRRHNRFLHGWGIVCGIELSLKDETIHIMPGMALDCVGNEIILDEPIRARLPKERNQGYIIIFYWEQEIEPHGFSQQNCQGPEVQFTKIQEGAEVRVEEKNPTRGHRLRYSCGIMHGIPLGKLSKSRNRWILDRQFKRPRIR